MDSALSTARSSAAESSRPVARERHVVVERALAERAPRPQDRVAPGRGRKAALALEQHAQRRELIGERDTRGQGLEVDDGRLRPERLGSVERVHLEGRGSEQRVLCNGKAPETDGEERTEQRRTQT
jgi:hypothetical protein